ncbi:hypothetical protein [Deinococcus pimensis]|uniref:hypothetical protein n=1 Tax=Deinococcus pimensis TaxID=309888 RepID=UPI00047F22B3|nr:hypothetical protein [Deinococcus pimensis]
MNDSTSTPLRFVSVVAQATDQMHAKGLTSVEYRLFVRDWTDGPRSSYRVKITAEGAVSVDGRVVDAWHAELWTACLQTAICNGDVELIEKVAA